MCVSQTTPCVNEERRNPTHTHTHTHGHTHTHTLMNCKLKVKETPTPGREQVKTEGLMPLVSVAVLSAVASGQRHWWSVRLLFTVPSTVVYNQDGSVDTGSEPMQEPVLQVFVFEQYHPPTTTDPATKSRETPTGDCV